MTDEEPTPRSPRLQPIVERPNPFYPGLVRAVQERERRRRHARAIDLAVVGTVLLFAVKEVLSCS